MSRLQVLESGQRGEEKPKEELQRRKSSIPAMMMETKAVIPAPPMPEMARPASTCQYFLPMPL
jgi:hypothetical protein